ncbi:hypothetical protein KO494_13155 [Lacinutrix sp. C3R15]|uniref:hypothetical protein n=1 Tax=Flavobacteriaceae TaxID=49546 RepID=UPI001C09FA64|nr:MULTISPECIES: hypothetical protein [Flavobacteriaceae]MBU2940489.1 hypothetical protein [Lacinutrix sp. C3R15]MDO6623809.1 hypothetical protein [Oceanihabitans sp. 1_MG-2023]
MKLSNTKYNQLIKNAFKTGFGMVYCFDNFIVTEINEGVIFDLNYSKELTALIFDYYGPNYNLHVISNRVNNYSIVPTYWFNFYKNKNANQLKSVSFVYYNELAYLNAKLEEKFIKCKTECFKNLDDAICTISNIPNRKIA